MKLALTQPEKFVSTLDAQDMQKLFPEAYYSKYANHLKILHFEKNPHKEPIQKRKLKFTLHKSAPKPEKPIPSEKKVKMSRLEENEAAIEMNREQLEHLNQYRNCLNRKLEQGPQKKIGHMRVQSQIHNLPAIDLLQTMKAIEDHEYQEYLQLTQRRRKGQKTKFVKISGSLPNFHRHFFSRGKFQLPKKGPKLKLLGQKEKIKKVQGEIQSVIKKSQSVTSLLNPQFSREDQRLYILNLNRSMKKSLEIIKKNGLNDDNLNLLKAIRDQESKKIQIPLKEKDLKQETVQVRLKTNSLKLQSGYNHQIYSKNVKKYLSIV